MLTVKTVGLQETTKLITNVMQGFKTKPKLHNYKLARKLRSLMVDEINKNQRNIGTGNLINSITVDNYGNNYAVTVNDEAAKAIELGRKEEDFETFRNTKANLYGRKVIFMNGIGFRSIGQDDTISASKPMYFNRNAIRRLNKELPNMNRELIKDIIKK